MLKLAIVLFIVAAIFGSIILLAILKNKPTPKTVVFMHGLFALIAVLLVALFAIRSHGDSMPTLSLVLFLVATVGGLTLFTIDMLKKPIPKALAVLHPVIAVGGLVALIGFVF
jgi:hypothetical protein